MDGSPARPADRHCGCPLAGPGLLPGDGCSLQPRAGAPAQAGLKPKQPVDTPGPDHLLAHLVRRPADRSHSAVQLRPKSVAAVVVRASKVPILPLVTALELGPRWHSSGWSSS